MKKTIYLLLFSLLLVMSCNRNSDAPITDDNTVPTGKVSGKVLSKNGAKPIGGALVFTFDKNEKMYYTYSSANGDFSFDAPEGLQTINIQTGGGENFRTEVKITIKKDQTVTIPLSDSKLTQVAAMAYVKGSYDKIEDIITSLGYTATEISYNDLKNMNTVAQYDIIFLNCGSRGFSNTGTSTPSADAVVYNNLSTFVTNGGSLYASDWAVAYLVGGDTNTTNCGAPGGFINDNLLCAKNNGSSGNYTGCLVSNANLASALGFTNLDIQYDLGAWEKIQNYDPNFWDVLVKKDSEALMIRTGNYTNPSSPVVPCGNSSNDNHITICHHPDGGNPITISINQNAWPAHQAHGDTLGACTSSSTSGNIYFTTFHNHASGNIGNAGNILEYVILNL